MNNQINKLMEQMLRSRLLRKFVSASSHIWFFTIYFPHYITYPTAPFQREVFKITEDQENKLAVICAFRGSGKSTIMGMSYPLWAILGKPQKKFILVLSQTQEKAQVML